ncbi:hypothetical protein AB832_01085 [Flavobacteriaceae bacterium (ex Bugula neritina AB1)]|nr:hypothetical protein AB832_01085 [Flavobacteriaceae bacterium (ex Bugula neritina AB1)]
MSVRGAKIKKRLGSPYDPRNCKKCSKFHKGVDINLGGGDDDFGAPILAIHSGIVVSIKTVTNGSGRQVYRSPDGSFQTRYFQIIKNDKKYSE